MSQTKPNDRMTAVVCHGPEDYRVEQVARPNPGAREMVIRIFACGICASDCKCWGGAKLFWGDQAMATPAYSMRLEDAAIVRPVA
jgi:L-iditol 2-dehydrogenase